MQAQTAAADAAASDYGARGRARCGASPAAGRRGRRRARRQAEEEGGRRPRPAPKTCCGRSKPGSRPGRSTGAPRRAAAEHPAPARRHRPPAQQAEPNAMEEFHKVRRLPPYVFEEVNRLKATARAAGADIIDLGMGNPDLPTPPFIVDKLCEVIRDPRSHRYSASKGIAGPAQGAGGLLRPPLRREARPRHPGRRDARLEGRLRQHGAGDHRAGRRGAVPEPDLPDPRLRLPDGRRHDPRDAGQAGRRLLRRDRPGGAALDPQADRHHPELPVEPDGLRGRSRLLPRDRRLRPQARDHRACPTSPMPRSTSTATRRPRSSRWRARWTSRSSSPRCRRRSRCPAGGSASPSATSG